MTTTPAEVTESEATGSVADAYDVIRSALRSTFVPTIYRRLALHPEAFAIAVARMPDVVRVGDDTGFIALACDTARSELPIPNGTDASALQGVSSSGNGGPAAVLDRYRRANPINLLFSLSICGLTAPPEPSVMAPPLPAYVAAGVWADIEACHRSPFVPGVWRELAPWPDVVDDLWPRVRALAAADGLVAARDSVRLLAVDALSGTVAAQSATEVRAALDPDAAASFDWFPTGVATMIAEVEWLTWYSGTPHQGKDRP